MADDLSNYIHFQMMANSSQESSRWLYAPSNSFPYRVGAEPTQKPRLSNATDNEEGDDWEKIAYVDGEHYVVVTIELGPRLVRSLIEEEKFVLNLANAVHNYPDREQLMNGLKEIWGESIRVNTKGVYLTLGYTLCSELGKIPLHEESSFQRISNLYYLTKMFLCRFGGWYPPSEDYGDPEVVNTTLNLFIEMCDSLSKITPPRQRNSD